MAQYDDEEVKEEEKAKEGGEGGDRAPTQEEGVSLTKESQE